MNYRLMVLLEKVLGKGKQTSGTNVAFFSPFCNHHKRKLEINLETVDGKNPWHCWISNERGKTIYSLFKKIKATPEIIKELQDCIGISYTHGSNKDTERLELPVEFKPLCKLKKEDLKIPEIKHALVYLNSRNITPTDIKRYNIGVCVDGEYKNRIVVPSYDEYGCLNYFVSRSFMPDEYIKYKNPKNSKSIIPFDLYINWELPIFLVEGVFDAIAIRFNAIPLLGKTLSVDIKKKIIEKKPPSIYVALDADAKKAALDIIKCIKKYNIPVYYVNPQKKDPSEMGHSEFFEEINNAVLCSTESLIKLELSI